MTAQQNSNLLLAGVLFALGSAALFAIRPIFVKLVYAQGVDVITLIAFRMLFSLPIYLGLLVWFLRRPERRARLNLKNVIGTGVVGLFGYYIASYLDLLGLQHVTAQLGRLILYTYPSFVVIFGALFFREKITRQILVSLALTYAGVAIIFGHDLNEFGKDVWLGALYIIGCAVTFSFYLLFSKSLISEMGSKVFTCIALISASLAILIHYSLQHSLLEPQINATAMGWVFVIAIFCTVIPTFFTTAAVERIGANKTSIVAMTGPVFTSVFAVWVLSEVFTVYHAIGMTITAYGVWLLQRKKKAPKRNP